MNKKIAVIGECMLELSASAHVKTDSQRDSILSYGGDTLNTSVYLSRLGVEVEYITALGDDSMSDWLQAQWQSEGVGTQHVQRYANSVPGLYMIELDKEGERSFLYWRKDSPATRLFNQAESADQIFEQIQDCAWIYLSGITLALYPDEARERLFDGLQNYRKHGGKIIFDNNYRPGQWLNTSQAKTVYEKMYGLTDLALPSLEDELLVSGVNTQDDVIKRLEDFGIAEIVLKMGEKSCFVIARDIRENVNTEKVNVVDTTSAGDSFNAGYIAARLKGHSPVQSCITGHLLASTVIQQKGAIIPKSMMPALNL